jgi:N6-L-threonylcarbamoyladenine synthase
MVGAMPLLALGVETSCDETAAAVVVRDGAGRGRILANVVRSQWERHRPYGGVVPEIAARAHVSCLDMLIREALAGAGVGFSDLDLVAATAGPGLIGGLMVGLVTAKALGLAIGRPVAGVNHLEAHALTVGLSEGLRPPYLLLLVSGGHTQIVLVEDVGRYVRLATTIDDALGEAFDKTAKLLGLPQPGGPSVERAAAAGRSGRFALPRPMLGRREPHFSFAGLKTAVRQAAERAAPLSAGDVADLCRDFEEAVAASVADRVALALAAVGDRLGSAPRVVIAGGVAANQRLRAVLGALAVAHGATLHAPPLALCGDNAAMVAWAALERHARGLGAGEPVVARARWPLDSVAAPALGGGRLGAKA